MRSRSRQAKLAKQADGAVEVRIGNTMLLATVCSAKEAGEGVDFMPLTVEYKRNTPPSAVTTGGFLKREGRASDYEILTSAWLTAFSVLSSPTTIMRRLS